MFAPTTSLNDVLRFNLCGKHILSFLTAKDALSYATTSKTNRATSYLGTLDPVPLKHERGSPGSIRGRALHWGTQYSSHDRGLQGYDPLPYQEIRIPMVNGTHSVSISCSWQDQGWGNRKGMLYILGCKDIPEAFSSDHVVCQTAGVAEHDWRPLRLEFQPEEGKRYFLWYKVGGGGGHELFVRDLMQRSVIYDTFGGHLVRQHRSLIKNGAFEENPLVSLLLHSVATYAQRSFTEEGASMDESIFGALDSLGLSPSNKEAMDALVFLVSLMYDTMSNMPDAADDQGAFDDDENDDDYMDDYDDEDDDSSDDGIPFMR